MIPAAGSYRSGFVGVVGRPNVGKSTLMNYFVGEQVAIVSPKPQTTRQRILGLLTRADVQIAFLDTPGFQEPHHLLGRYMLEVTKAVIEESDVLVTVIDARKGLVEADEQLFARIRRSKRPALLAINKVDLVQKPRLLPLIEACAKRGTFLECIPVSALRGTQMDVLLKAILPRLPEGPRWYEATQQTDQPVSRRISELIRQQILFATRQEVPHAVAVLVEDMEDRARLTVIRATILVERSGQKAIIIGRGGSLLKVIGQAARQSIERLLRRRVHLELWVKVKEDWRSDPRILRDLGYAA